MQNSNNLLQQSVPIKQFKLSKLSIIVKNQTVLNCKLLTKASFQVLITGYIARLFKIC